MHLLTPTRPCIHRSGRFRITLLQALFTSLLLPLLFLLDSPLLSAQQPQLRIVVIAGQDALNNTQASSNANVVVEIRGTDQMPIPGVAVTFVYPMQGASGTFPNGTRQMTVNTGADGRATATGVRPIGGTGTLQLRVTASYLGRTATAVIPQTNVAALVQEPRPTASSPQATPAQATSSTPATSAQSPAPHRGMRKSTKILIIVAIAAGATAGAVVATHRGSSSSPSSSGPPPIVITPGTPTVGGPQ